MLVIYFWVETRGGLNPDSQFFVFSFLLFFFGFLVFIWVSTTFRVSSQTQESFIVVVGITNGLQVVVVVLILATSTWIGPFPFGQCSAAKSLVGVIQCCLGVEQVERKRTTLPTDLCGSFCRSRRVSPFFSLSLSLRRFRRRIWWRARKRLFRGSFSAEFVGRPLSPASSFLYVFSG